MLSYVGHKTTIQADRCICRHTISHNGSMCSVFPRKKKRSNKKSGAKAILLNLIISKAFTTKVRRVRLRSDIVCMRLNLLRESYEKHLKELANPSVDCKQKYFKPCHLNGFMCSTEDNLEKGHIE